LYFLFRFV